MCDIDLGDDGWRMWKYTPHVARKQHTCHGCGSPIRSGDPYCSLFAVGDHVTNERMCFACWWTLTAFGDAHGFSTAPSALEEFLVECSDDGGHDNPWRIDLAALKRRWRVSQAGRGALAKKWARRREYEAKIQALRPT